MIENLVMLANTLAEKPSDLNNAIILAKEVREANELHKYLEVRELLWYAERVTLWSVKETTKWPNIVIDACEAATFGLDSISTLHECHATMETQLSSLNQ